MNVKLLTEHHFEIPALKGGFTSSSESTFVKLPHSWKSHIMGHIFLYISGCEANPDVNLQNKKFGIKLYIPGPDGMEEIWLRFEAVRFTIISLNVQRWESSLFWQFFTITI